MIHKIPKGIENRFFVNSWSQNNGFFGGGYTYILKEIENSIQMQHRWERYQKALST